MAVPRDVEARAGLGHVYHDLHQWAEAEACFRQVVLAEGESALAHYHLGGVLQSQGRAAEAAECYRRALALDPRLADAHNNLGTLLKDRKELEAAQAQFEQALRAEPAHAPALTNLALLYEARGDYARAGEYYRAAVAADASSAIARHGLGVALEKQGRTEEALACYQESLRLDPKLVSAYFSISYLFQMQGRPDTAVSWCQEALRIEPNNANVYNNLGAAWNELGKRDDAIACFRRAIELQPTLAVSYSNLGVALQALGRLDEALQAHRSAVGLEPDNAGSHSNLLYALNYPADQDPAAVFAEHRTWGSRHADPLTAASPPHRAMAGAAGRKLRVGYVSPHFHAHAVNFFSEPILASHDHHAFEVYCYSDVKLPDETTRRLMGYADHWRETQALGNEQLAHLVRQDGVDILVDLTGHISGGKRMLVFARKPAPIQVTYIGYQNTTGMLAMDYRLTDEYSDPPGTTDSLHTERLVRLPRTFFCYLPSPDAPPVVRLPALDHGYISFGSVNNFTKVTPQVLAAWAAIVKQVPRSRLVLLADMVDSLREYLLRTLAGHGVDPSQVELVNRLPRAGYLSLINRLDIALDPFPFNGHTTTCDCLWQGVPVVTLSGTTYVSRFGGSGLATLGLNDWIAHHREAYVERAVAHALDIGALAALRAELRQRMLGSPLLDFEAFTRNLEAAYRQMWDTWCRTTSEASEPKAR
jgi:predicted O-linked N-acetylglucosamine transferase (SPINDLY family)